jgi:transcriptional regulator with XRE-family HTH domain
MHAVCRCVRPAVSAFGAELRRLRSERGLSYRALAARVYCSYSLIRHLEIDRRQPSAQLALALDQVLDAGGLLVVLATSPGALPPWGDGPDRLASVVNGRVHPDQTTVDYMVDTLARHRTAEDHTGPQVVLPTVLAQATTVAHLRALADGQVREALLELESHCAQFAGWCYQDVTDYSSAEQWYARALDLAHEGDDPNMIASVLSMRSNQAWQRRDVHRAVGLGAAACRPPGATPGVLALSHQQHARARAAAGERRDCERALLKADELQEQAWQRPDREPPWVYFQDAARLTIQRATCYSELGDHRRAVDLFEAGLRQLRPEFRRDRGQYLARLAGALGKAGDQDGAREKAAEARELAEQTGSRRTLTLLRHGT